MSLYVNRLRYGFGAPTIGVSSGIVNMGYYNGVSLYDDDYVPPPPVNYVKNIYTTATVGNYYIDTLINTLNTKQVRAIITPRYYTGAFLLGNNLPGDSNDFRFFNTSLDNGGSTCYLDWGTGRTHVLSSEIKQNVEVDITIYNDVSGGYVYLWLTDGGSTSNYLIKTARAGTLSTGAMFLASISYLKLSLLQIWDYNDNMLCDLRAALDENDVPSMYDELSETYFYNAGSTTTLEYDPIPVPVTLNVSSNDQTMGTVTGGGTYYTGDSVTIVATATGAAYGFSGWYDGNDLVSNNATYSFTITSNTTLEARFYAKQQYTVSLSVNDQNLGSTTGAGTYYDGDTVTVTAIPSEGYEIEGWYENGTLVSTDDNYSFIITGNVSLQAIFIVGHDYNLDYFTIESLDDGNTISINKSTYASAITFYYSLNNGTTWTKRTTTTSWNVNTGDKILIKSETNTWKPGSGWWNFSSTKNFNVYGNVMSLTYGDNFVGQTTLKATYTFYYLFMSCTHLINAENLILPATTLADFCYNAMFIECSGLLTAPKLPATTLTSNCYSTMFSRCTSLTTAPELPATTLTNYCYGSMFYGCSSLNYIKCLATNISAQGCLQNWVDGVAATGTFVKDSSMSSWPTGVNGIPSGWTVVNA